MFKKLNIKKLSQKELRILFEAMDNYYNDVMIDKRNEYSINDKKEINDFIYQIEIAYLHSRVAERDLKWKMIA
tara:strand:- start:397 stop:615 length:219 start_codon:yes stop_codon:yes gene_type:complete